MGRSIAREAATLMRERDQRQDEQPLERNDRAVGAGVGKSSRREADACQGENGRQSGSTSPATSAGSTAARGLGTAARR